jgi:hypothetical protein
MLACFRCARPRDDDVKALPNIAFQNGQWNRHRAYLVIDRSRLGA